MFQLGFNSTELVITLSIKLKCTRNLNWAEFQPIV